MAGREVRVAILGDSRDFSRAVSAASRDAGRLEGAFSKVGGLAKTAAVGLGAAAIGGVALGKSFLDAAYESQKVTKQTEAVIKSMGGAAGVTAKHVADFAATWSNISGIDDELIQSSQNVLMTFGNIRNDTKKGIRTFDEASVAVLNMSTALGMDLNSSAMMVGKALNDPVRGLGMLRKAGIQFTKQQEWQIKTMAEAGDVAGAQAVMLGELNRQFGGSAQAQATAADRLKVAWGNVQEELGAKLIPVVEKVATWLADHLPGAMASAQSFMDNTLIPAFRRVSAFVQEHWPRIRDAVVGAVEGIRSLVTPIVGAIQTLWDNFGNNILEFVQRVWPRIQQIIDGAMTIIRGVIQTVTALIKGDWSAVWEGIKGILSGAWTAIQGIVGGALEVVRTILGAGLEIIGSVFKSAWSGIVGWFWSLPSKVGEVASRIWEALKSGLAAAIRWIGNQLDRLLGPLDEIISKVNKITGGSVGGAIKGAIPGLNLIPGFHSGGVFQAPSGMTEGLALLRNGERVLSPSQTRSSGGGGDTIVLNLEVGGQLLDRLVVDTGSRTVRRGYAA